MERCAKLIKMISDEIKKQANNQLSSHDLTMMQIDVLMLLNEAKDHTLSLKRIEKLLYVAQSTCASIVMRLERKNFVKTFIDSEDKRIKMVCITPLGEKNWEIVKNSMDDAEEKLLKTLNEKERTQLKILLNKIYKGLK